MQANVIHAGSFLQAATGCIALSKHCRQACTMLATNCNGHLISETPDGLVTAALFEASRTTTMAPSPVRKSHCSFCTSTGICPTLWHASRRYGTPAAAAADPTASASYTLPLLVGMWLIDTRAGLGCMCNICMHDNCQQTQHKERFEQQWSGMHYEPLPRWLEHFQQGREMWQAASIRGDF